MPTFTYQAVDTQGRPTSGTIAASGQSAAVELVLGQGLHPITVEEKAAGAQGGLATRFNLVGRISSSSAESFIRELGHLLAGGVPLSRALPILAREASNPAARKAWNEIREDVVGGMALAAAMGKYPRAFPPVALAMVRAGEEGGFLDVVLGQIADFRARERELKGRVKAAMIYPAVLVTLMVGVLIFLLTYFIPRFQTIFDDFGAALPKLTQIIIGLSAMVREYGLILAIVVIGLLLAASRLMRSDAGRRKLEQITLATPGIGTVTARFALVRFARMLGTLIGAGVPLMSALKTARDALGNQTLHDAVGHSIERVRQGESLAKSLADCPRLFPGSVVEMIAVAEETSRLDKELVRLAGVYEGDLDRRLRNLVAMLEPLLLLIMAAAVGTIVVGMLLPVFTLQDLIQ